jgi:carbon monoxide dehydrogenase subunit G
MEIKGEYRIPAPRQKVWEALNDPEILKKTIPGCDELVKVSDTEMNGKVTAKVGPVSAKFAGKVTLSDIKPPESYTIFGEGQGGVAGFAKGGAKVSLAEDGAETVLTYVADAQVGGKLAQIGSRLIQSTATVMANQFFGKFAEVVAQSGAAAAPSVSVTAPQATGPAAAVPSPAPAPMSAKTRGTGGGMSSTVWIVGLVILVAIVLAIFAIR